MMTKKAKTLSEFSAWEWLWLILIIIFLVFLVAAVVAGSVGMSVKIVQLIIAS